ncbi:MAG: DUF5916 domain-containing protein, partial [Bacteroidota bacterium]
RTPDGLYALDGYAAAVRPAGEGAPGGAAGRLLLGRISAEHWFATASHEFFSRGFDPNDIGFFARPHDHGGYLQVLYRENFAHGWVRRYSAALNPEYRWNWDGVRTQARVNLTGSAELTGFWTVSVTLTHEQPAYEDSEFGLTGIYRRPAGNALTASVQTDPRRDVALLLQAACAADLRRKREFSALMIWTLRPVPWMELTPEARVRFVRKGFGGVFHGGGIAASAEYGTPMSLFGETDLEEADLALGGILTFSRSLSIQFTAQALAVRARYGEFALLEGDRRFRRPAALPGMYDFNYAAFNANVLLRWEYLPGSTLYCVWTQERTGDTGSYAPSLPRRIGEIAALPREDILLVKLSYWFGL